MIRPPTVTVFTLPGCGECISTIRWLRDHGMNYKVVNLVFDHAARAEMKALGYLAAPIVRTADGVEWAGHRPSLLACLLPDDATTNTDTDTDTTTGAAGQAGRSAGGRDVTQRQVAAG